MGEIKKGMIHINERRPYAPCIQTLESQLIIIGTIIFRGPFFIGTGNKIMVSNGAVLDLGANGEITDMTNITCYSRITIGENCSITHRCQVIDTNNHYLLDIHSKTTKNYNAPILIGKNCWICNSSSIYGKTVLPDYTIVGSHSITSKDYRNLPDSPLIGGVPAKLISHGQRRIFNAKLENELVEYFNDKEADTFVFREVKEDYFKC